MPDILCFRNGLNGVEPVPIEKIIFALTVNCQIAYLESYQVLKKMRSKDGSTTKSP